MNAAPAPAAAARVAVVTGAASGIGAAVAAELSSRGWRVGGLDLVACPRCDTSVVVDVTEPGAVSEAVATIAGELGPVSAAVSVAGHYAMAPVSEITADQWTRMLRVHLGGLLHLTRAVLPGMIAQGSGRIINVSSELGLIGFPAEVLPHIFDLFTLDTNVPLDESGLGIGLALLLADVGVAQDVQALGIGRHHAVLDAVVDHLHEVTGTVRPAMQEALLGRARVAAAPARALDAAGAGREGLEDRRQVRDDRWLAADHQAVAAVLAGDAAAGADVDVVLVVLGKLVGPADIVAVVGVAAIDDDVAGLEERREPRQLVVDDGGGHHHPDGARRGHLRDQVGERRGSRRAVLLRSRHGSTVHVVDHAFVALLQEAAHHACPHPPQPDHSQLHRRSPSFQFARGGGCRDGGSRQASTTTACVRPSSRNSTDPSAERRPSTVTPASAAEAARRQEIR